ncbi:hypothetical protein JCM9957A_08170 [Kineosporia succinea]
MVFVTKATGTATSWPGSAVASADSATVGAPDAGPVAPVEKEFVLAANAVTATAVTAAEATDRRRRMKVGS